MKKRTFDRKTAAIILVLYRIEVRENLENPPLENWEQVCGFYHKVSTLAALGIISEKAQKRASEMFDECTAVL